MKAIVIDGKELKLDANRAVPKLRPDQVLIKTQYIALNPTDWKHAAFGLGASGSISGCDFSGIVEEVGGEVTKPFEKGDKICGVAHGGNASNPDDGVFAEYAVVKGDLLMHVPSNLTMEQASTFPLGAITCGQGLYQKALELKLPTQPTTDGEYVLVYGGSTATGSLACQYAKLSGYKVVTTCSPKHNEWMKRHDITPFDYNDSACGAQIRKHTNDSLKFAFDTISVKESAQICADALSTGAGGKYGALLDIKCPRDDVKSTTTLMYTIFDEAFTIAGMQIPRITEDFEFAKTFFEMTEKLLAEGKLQTHPDKLREGGLQGAMQGMEEMKKGMLSGEKWVYKLADTE